MQFSCTQIGINISFIYKSHEFGIPDLSDRASLFQWGLYKQFSFIVTESSVSK